MDYYIHKSIEHSKNYDLKNVRFKWESLFCNESINSFKKYWSLP